MRFNSTSLDDMSVIDPAAAAARRALRQQLLMHRQAFVSSAAGEAAASALAAHLGPVLLQLEPQRLGVYWAVRAEFNPALALKSSAALAAISLALPYCRREPREMHYREWNGLAPTAIDECKIATSDGSPVAPDVVLAPCVGYTREGYRLGYGGGYFDRWLAAHPHAIAVGIAWTFSELPTEALAPREHDIPLAVIVTESGVVGLS